MSHDRTADSYAKWYRYPVGDEAATVEILDENVYVKDAPYFYIGAFAPSIDGRYLAFTYDIVGDESYNLVIRCVTLHQAATPPRSL